MKPTKPRAINARSLYWMLTFNNISNYSDNQVQEYAKQKIEENLIHYFIIAREEAPTTKKIHFHAALSFSALKSLTSLKNMFPGAHIDVIKEGKQGLIKAIEYVIKGGNIVYENGPKPRIVQKTATMRDEFSALVQKIKTHTLTVEDQESYCYAKNRTFLDQLFMKYNKSSTFNGDLKAKNIWIYGPPGTGKSSMVWSFIDTEKLIYYTKNQNKWWDGYNLPKIVLIEDASPEKMKHLADHIKIWADRYSYTMEVKGSSLLCQDNSYYFVITSNYSISSSFSQEDAEAISRRFTEVRVDSAYPLTPGAQYEYEQLELVYFGDGESLSDDSLKAKLFRQFVKPQSFELDKEPEAETILEPEDVSIDLSEEWQWQPFGEDEVHDFDRRPPTPVPEPPRCQAPAPPTPPRTKTRELLPRDQIDPSIQIEEDIKRWNEMFFPEQAQKTPSQED